MLPVKMHQLSPPSRRSVQKLFPAFLLLYLLALGCSDSETKNPTSEKTGPSSSDTSASTHPSYGRWHPVEATYRGLTQEQVRAMERLEALPYLKGRENAPDRSGVIRFNEIRLQPGVNLYNSGHAPEALAIDLSGKVLHRWSMPMEEIWEEVPEGHQSTYWRRVTWLPGGDILAIVEGRGLIRLDRQSRLKWAYRAAIHHQAIEDLDGTILTLERQEKILPRINPAEPVHEDFLLRLSADGELIERISLLEAIEDSEYRSLLSSAEKRGDFMHTNSIQILGGPGAGRHPSFKPGQLLLSIFFLDTICVLDPQRKVIVWALRGDGEPSFKGQHDPRLLPTGNLLLLDNWGRSGQSKVIEFDPVTMQLAWLYPTDEKVAFSTPTAGTSQRLANGNTLITESDRGRAFEVTREGEIVWEFLNPHRAGERDELIATLFEVRRVDADFLKW